MAIVLLPVLSKEATAVVSDILLNTISMLILLSMLVEKPSQSLKFLNFRKAMINSSTGLW